VTTVPGRPLIGITTYLEPVRWGAWDQPAALIPQSYVDGVARAGGLPVLLPPAGLVTGLVTGPGTDGAADAVRAIRVIRAIDGLVLSGGADIDPTYYGEPARPTTVIRPDRDAWEFAVLGAALEHGTPVLAICRGMQLLNVECGGTLHQHLPDVVDGTWHQPAPGVFGHIPVRTAPASRVSRLLGGHVTAWCHHHQAIRELGIGLEAVAWAGDGTIEAIEHTGREFVLGVQWHPEQDTDDARLFQALMCAASHA
jgi:putative glutamine amidotransferase